MTRRLMSSILLPGLLFLLLIAGMNVGHAAPSNLQATSDPIAEGSEGEDVMAGETLAQPVNITVRQRLPISVELSQLGIATETLPFSGSLGLALDLKIEFVVTNTLTSTVPSTITVVFADEFLNALPISLTLDGESTAMVTFEPQGSVTATVPVTAPIAGPEDVESTPVVTSTTPVTSSAEITASPPITSSPALTVTDPATPTVDSTPAIAPTSSVTANLRAGPGTTFALVGTAAPGEELNIAGITDDGTWYLLSDGSWIFGELVDNPPTDVPIATQALIDAVTAAAAEEAAQAEDTVTDDAAADDTATDDTAADDAAADDTATDDTAADDAAADDTATDDTATDDAAADDTAADDTATDDAAADDTVAPIPTANADANLRAGPGTGFDVVGGTVTGQELDIIGQNATGDWYLLSNGGWIADFLVSNAPADAPVVADDASPFLTGDEIAPVLVPTPVPGASSTPQAAAEPDVPEVAPAEGGSTSLGLAENLYLDEAQTLLSRYTLTSDAVTQLVADAAADGALLNDEQWAADISTAIATLQRSGQQIRALDPPPLLAAAHIDLRSAAASFDEAATALTAGIDQASIVQLQEAVTQIAAGASQLEAAQAKIDAVS